LFIAAATEPKQPGVTKTSKHGLAFIRDFRVANIVWCMAIKEVRGGPGG